MNTIAVDCGASFIKGALVSEGKIIKRSQKSSPVVHGNEPLTSPIQINSLLPLVKEIIAELSADEKEARLCISNEMHGFILADENANPITDYISWQKEYGKAECEMLSQEQYANDILHSGMPLRAGLPNCNLLYVLKQLSNVNGKIYFYTLGDYLEKAVSGIEPNCHPTNAAATGLYDLRTKDWNKNIIKSFKLENIVFPKIGTETIQFDFDGKNIELYPALGDQQAALLGAGLKSENDLFFNLGTGAQVGCLVGDVSVTKNYQIRPYFFGKYIKCIPHLPSGRALNVFVRFIKDLLSKADCNLSDDEIWKLILDAEGESSNSNLKCDLSFFENPITDKTVGSITNIEENSFYVGNLFNSIFSQMAKNFLQCANIVCSDKSKIERIIFSGGVARKIEKIRKLILSDFSNITDIKIAQDETLLGLYKYSVMEEI